MKRLVQNLLLYACVNCIKMLSLQGDGHFCRQALQTQTSLLPKFTQNMCSFGQYNELKITAYVLYTLPYVLRVAGNLWATATTKHAALQVSARC